MPVLRRQEQRRAAVQRGLVDLDCARAGRRGPTIEVAFSNVIVELEEAFLEVPVLRRQEQRRAAVQRGLVDLDVLAREQDVEGPPSRLLFPMFIV